MIIPLKKKYYTGIQIHEAIDGVVNDYQKAIEIYRRLAAMETEDIEPKKGKWEPLAMDDFMCSQCEVIVKGELIPFMHYCPNCGARMEGENDG